MDEDLPRGWTRRALGELCQSEGRYGSGEPALPYDPALPRYIRITDMDDRQRLRPETRASLPRDGADPFLLAPGDMLFARSGTTVGKTYVYDPRDGLCAHAGYLIRFSLDDQRCHPPYVAQYVRSPAYWSWVSRTTRQAAQPNINATEFGALEIPLPPMEDQRRIAKILDTWDRLVDVSLAILGRLEGLHRALVDDLLTNGPPAHKTPFWRTRETPIGPLPAHWRVAQVGELLTQDEGRVAMRSGPFGSQLKKRDLVDRGVPLLGIDNVGVDTFVAHYRRFVSDDTYRRLVRYAVYPDDVMVTIMGTVGRSCVVPSTIGRALSSKHVWTLSFDPSRYIGLLASAQFNHAPWVRSHFRRDEQGGTMGAIRSDTLRTTLLPVPPMGEQRCIAEILARVQDRIHTERAVMDKHERTRQSLMADLFRGRAPHQLPMVHKPHQRPVASDSMTREPLERPGTGEPRAREPRKRPGTGDPLALEA